MTTATRLSPSRSAEAEIQNPASEIYPVFQAGQTLIAFEHFIGVGKRELSIPYAVHPNPRILKYFGMPQQLAGDQRQVARRGQRFLAHAVQSVGIDELRVRAAKLGRALVHPFDERRLGSRQMLSHGDRTVIGRADRNRLEHIVQRKLLARFQPDLRPTHRAGILATGNHRIQRNLSSFERLHRQQHGHDLCHGRGLQRLVGIHGIQLLPVRRIERGRFGVQRPHFRKRQRRWEQQAETQRETNDLFHPFRPPFLFHPMRQAGKTYPRQIDKFCENAYDVKC